MVIERNQQTRRSTADAPTLTADDGARACSGLLAITSMSTMAEAYLSSRSPSPPVSPSRVIFVRPKGDVLVDDPTEAHVARIRKHVDEEISRLSQFGAGMHARWSLINQLTMKEKKAHIRRVAKLLKPQDDTLVESEDSEDSEGEALSTEPAQVGSTTYGARPVADILKVLSDGSDAAAGHLRDVAWVAPLDDNSALQSQSEDESSEEDAMPPTAQALWAGTWEEETRRKADIATAQATATAATRAARRKSANEKHRRYRVTRRCRVRAGTALDSQVRAAPTG